MAPHDRMISLPRNSSGLPRDRRLHPHAALPLENQFGDLGIGGNRQILPQPRAGIEVADRRRHPPFIGVGDGDRKIPVLPRRVLVLDEFPPRLLERLAHRLGVFRPKIGKNAPHRDAPFASVPWTLEVHVALDLLEVGQHAVPVPAGGTPRRPLVVIGRRTAVRELPVDRRPATQDARLLIGPQRRRPARRGCCAGSPRW